VLNECRRGNSERISKSEFRFIFRVLNLRKGPANAAFAKPDLISIDLNSGIAPPSRRLTGRLRIKVNLARAYRVTIKVNAPSNAIYLNLGVENGRMMRVDAPAQVAAKTPRLSPPESQSDQSDQ
jgi:hypothetical protein